MTGHTPQGFYQTGLLSLVPPKHSIVSVGSYGQLKDRVNRKIISDLANDSKYYIGKDKWGNDWHIRQNEDGTQDPVEHQNQVISDGGRNVMPKSWDDETGLKYNPLRGQKK